MNRIMQKIKRIILSIIYKIRIHRKGKNIIIFSRKKDANLGDVIIGDCVKWILEYLSDKRFIKINTKVLIANISTKNTQHISEICEDKDTIVFPGGGVNSIKYDKKVIRVLEYSNIDSEIFFNASGICNDILKTTKLKYLVMNMFSDKRIKQITTRGDVDIAKNLIATPKQYPLELILDPAMWAGNTYHIKKRNGSRIGLGLIRPEIFEERHIGLTTDEIMSMYKGIIEELDKRGYKWSLFCNGTESDYEFGIQLLDYLGIDEDGHLVKRPEKERELVRIISTYKGIIAARFHANIIATSLDIPSVALVWNNKMMSFAGLIGCTDRYINDPEILRQPTEIVDIFERALDEGYNKDLIADQKKRTLKVMNNIIKSKKHK